MLGPRQIYLSRSPGLTLDHLNSVLQLTLLIQWRDVTESRGTLQKNCHSCQRTTNVKDTRTRWVRLLMYLNRKLVH